MYRMGTSPGSPPDYFKGQSHSKAYLTRCIPAYICGRVMTLDVFRSQIAGMLVTVDRTGTNIPDIPEGIRDPCCSQTRPPK